MKRIRIDTDQIKKTADSFEVAADCFLDAGDDILRVASGLPGYGGMLDKPAFAAGYACRRMLHDMHREIRRDARSLRDAAKAFEDVDQQTLKAIGKNHVRLAAAGGRGRGLAMPAPVGGPVPPDDMTMGEPVGTAHFGYQKVGTRFIYLFFQGRTIIVDLTVIDVETYAQVEAFLQDVEDWNSALAEFCGEDVDQLVTVLQEFFFGAGALASTPITSLLGAVVAGGAWAKTFIDAGKWTEEFEADWNALWEMRAKAADVFSGLDSNPPDGVLARPTTREEINLFN
jgi:hypothetical protein